MRVNVTVRTLTLVKGSLRFVFRYAPGREDQVVDEVIRLAEDGSSGLDWLDAARLGYQIAQQAAAECFRDMHLPSVPAKEGPCTNCP